MANAVKQLADWGASVIKVAGPGEDDLTGARDGSDAAIGILIAEVGP